MDRGGVGVHGSRAVTGRRKLVLFDMPSGTLPSSSTPSAVPLDASVSAIAA